MTTTTDESRRTLADFVSVWNTRDLDTLDDCIAEGYVQHHRGAAQGLDGLKSYFASQFAAMPDLHVRVEDTVCERDRAVARIALHFTRDGEPKQGEIIDIWRLEGGKLAEHWSGDPVIADGT